MLLVPEFHQVIGALADVFPVDDFTLEDARRVELVDQLRIGAVIDGNFAVKIDTGREGAQPFQTDSSPGDVAPIWWKVR